MEMQISPNRWSCTLASFAMALDVPIAELADEVGHDGSEIIFPALTDPQRRRAFHVQEFIAPCIRRNYAPVIVEPAPCIGANLMYIYHLPTSEVLLTQLMTKFTGVIFGQIRGQMHACAWDKSICYDPAGYCHGLTDYQIREFLALIPTESNQPNLENIFQKTPNNCTFPAICQYNKCGCR